MKNHISNLVHMGVIEISGEDAMAFLQAQFTCDLNQISEGRCLPGAWCNPKGRVIASFFIVSQQDSYLLLLPRELIEKVCKRLQMFVLRSKVNIDSRGDYSCYGLYVDEPDQVFPLDTPDEIVLATLPGDVPGRIVMAGPGDINDKFASGLQESGMSATAPEAWDLQDLKAGIPWILSATSEQVLPQELNLDSLGGLSYNKGCYPGQEIVARLHFRGRLKRRLYGGYIESKTASPLTGTKLSRQGETNSSGLIINSIRESAGTVRILAVVNIEDAGTTQLHTAEGDIFHLLTPVPEQ